jgi:murein L,D-transpeptidase YafK
LSRPVVRALLASAAVAAAIALAGCYADGIVPSGRAMAPLSEKTLALMSDKNMDKESPILVRIFKEEAELELWKKNRDGQYALLKTYPICRWSGDLGPKKKEGDRQAPEGFYTITPAQMNPNSNYYLAFNTGYPNAYDRAWGRTGSELMVHGDCSSRGCYAMTDEQIQEIYALARESFFGGQKAFQFEAFPFRMTALNMAKHRNNPNFAFWKMLKEGYDNFEATRQDPQVAVCDKRYVFDAAPPDGAKGPLHFNARGKCPVYRLDPTVADAVLDYRRQEQVKMANYIAIHVATVAPHVGDGGMNPVFAAAGTGADVDNSGRYSVASANGTPAPLSHVPGALPHVPNPPGTTIPKVGKPATAAAPTPESQPQPKSAPVAVASVRIPEPAPLPKEGRAPEPQQQTNIANLFGNLFKQNSQAAPAPTQVASAPPPAVVEPSEPVALRADNTGNAAMAAKPQHAEPKTRVASAPPVSLQPPKVTQQAAPKPQQVAAQRKPDSIWDRPKPKSVWDQPKAEPKPEHKSEPPKPRAVAKAEPAAKPRVTTAAAKQKAPAPTAAPEPEIRTAYAPTRGNGLLAGAQPVVPAGTFSNLR